MKEALGRLQRGVDRMAGWLEESGGPWIMGADLTMIDIAIMPVIVRMADINLDHMWADKSGVADWLTAIQNTDAYKATYYHGSLLTEKYPHLAKAAS